MWIFNILIGLAVACVIWFVVTTVMVYHALQKRGAPVSFIWLRAMAPIYAHQYRKITKGESGRVGPLFYHWIISINLALVLVIIAFIIGK